MAKPHDKVSREEMEKFPLPDSFSTTIVAYGEDGKRADGKPVFRMNELHVIRPNGRAACSCELDPKVVRVYPDVRTPPEWRYLFCAESAEYMQAVVFKLKGSKDEN